MSDDRHAGPIERSYDAIVIGAGPNGLVAATVLARGGKRVLLLERAAAVGGHTRPIDIAPGFRAPPLGCDSGWLPGEVARAIGIEPPAMVEPRTALTVRADGEMLSLPVELQRAVEVIRKRSHRDAERWARLASRLGKFARFLEAMYVSPPPDIDASAIGEMASLVALGRKFRALGRADMAEVLRVMPMPVQDLLDDELELESLKAGIAAGGIRDLRQGPRSGGTSFVLIHHLVGAQNGSARARPWWRDAPDAFARAADSAALDAGVTVRCGATVVSILVRDDAVAGVALEKGDEIVAPIVISTADPGRTIGMVDPVWLDPDFLLAIRNIKYRGCTAVVQYALDALPEFPGVRGSVEILSGITSLTPSLDALERAADAAKYGGISTHPHVEITVPSLRWPALAPEGKHVLVARAQYAPWRLRDDTGWDESRRSALGDAVTAAIGESVPGFGDRVLHRQVLAPPDIENEFTLTEGAPTHGELTLDQILFMRPVPGWGRHAMPVDGLYLGGAGAHPGPGVLGGAGWLAARRALRDRRRS